MRCLLVFTTLEYQKLCQNYVSQFFSELAETTKAEGFIAKDLDQENYAHAPEAQKVGHKDKLFRAQDHGSVSFRQSIKLCFHQAEVQTKQKSKWFQSVTNV